MRERYLCWLVSEISSLKFGLCSIERERERERERDRASHVWTELSFSSSFSFSLFPTHHQKATSDYPNTFFSQSKWFISIYLPLSQSLLFFAHLNSLTQKRNKSSRNPSKKKQILLWNICKQNNNSAMIWIAKTKSWSILFWICISSKIFQNASTKMSYL